MTDLQPEDPGAGGPPARPEDLKRGLRWVLIVLVALVVVVAVLVLLTNIGGDDDPSGGGNEGLGPSVVVIE